MYSTFHGNIMFLFACRISEIEPKYYADGEDAYAMKRNLVVWAKEQDIDPADPDSFFKSNKDHHKSEHDKKKSSWMTREK